MAVWAFLLLPVPLLALALLCIAWRFRARLLLEAAGGSLEVRVYWLLPVARLRFRLHLLSPPYLTVDWLRRDDTLRTVYRAGEGDGGQNPWAAAAWTSLRWRCLRVKLEVGDAAAPAASALAFAALHSALTCLLRRYLTPSAEITGTADAGGALFRLNVAGMATVCPAQIIRKRWQMRRRGRHVTSH